MQAWPPDCYRRATAYLTDPAGRLLVFDHVDTPESGTQVPAGGVEREESPEDAVIRELAEESGITAARVVRKLGESWFVAPAGVVPAGLQEQVHYAFHLEAKEEAAGDTWEWDECSGGDVAQHRFAFRWVEIEEAARVLHPIQAMWLTSLRSSTQRR